MNHMETLLSIARILTIAVILGFIIWVSYGILIHEGPDESSSFYRNNQH